MFVLSVPMHRHPFPFTPHIYADSPLLFFFLYKLILSIKQERIPSVINLATAAGQLQYVAFARYLLG